MLKYARGIGPDAIEQKSSSFEDQRKINPLANMNKAEIAQQALWTLDSLTSVGEFFFATIQEH